MVNTNSNGTPGWTRILDIVLMPLVVALVGGAATFFITRYQTQNAERIAAAQLASAERSARSERELRSLDLFTRLIESNSPKTRERAVRLLEAVDPDLATRLANAIATDDAETPAVRAEARTIVTSLQAGRVPTPFFLTSQGETAATIFRQIFNGHSTLTANRFLFLVQTLNPHIANLPRNPADSFPPNVIVVFPDPANPNVGFHWFRSIDIEALVKIGRNLGPSLVAQLLALRSETDPGTRVFFMLAARRRAHDGQVWPAFARPTGQGYRICVLFLKLFERVYAPLTAGLLRPVAADAARPEDKRHQLDRLYQRVVSDLDALWRAVGLQRAA